MNNNHPPTSTWEPIPYSGKLLKEKTFTNFVVLEPSTKFLHRIWACHTHLLIAFSIPQKFSPQNGHFFAICESFLPQNFPTIRYVTGNKEVITVGLSLLHFVTQTVDRFVCQMYFKVVEHEGYLLRLYADNYPGRSRPLPLSIQYS